MTIEERLDTMVDCHILDPAQRSPILALIREVERETRGRAAEAAEGAPYQTNPNTGEVSIRGTNSGNWSVPQPKAGFRGSDYGTGRYDAAAAVRAMEPAS